MIAEVTMMLALLAWTWAAPMPLGPAPGGGVSFLVGSSAGPSRGQLDVFEAEIDISTRSGRFVGQAATLSTGLGPRDQRMLYYALDVVAFPIVRFDIAKIEGSLSELASGVGSGVLRLLGTLSLRDVQAPLAVPATFAWENGVVHLTGDVAFAWADFGVPDPSVLIAKVDPSVRVSFNLAGSPP